MLENSIAALNIYPKGVYAGEVASPHPTDP